MVGLTSRRAAPIRFRFADPGERGQYGLYTINLLTGGATLVGNTGGGELIHGLAVAPPVGTSASIFAVTPTNMLLSFDSSDPGMILNRTQIFGLQASETILGIDFRPPQDSSMCLAARVACTSSTHRQNGDPGRPGSFATALSGPLSVSTSILSGSNTRGQRRRSELAARPAHHTGHRWHIAG